MAKRLLIMTGPGGDAQGWGDMKVTETMCEALNQSGLAAEVAYVETREDFTRAIEQRSFDILWCALYYLSQRSDIIGLAGQDDLWVADVFEAEGIPYIGPSAKTMKQLIQKYQTHRILYAAGVPVPIHHLVERGGPLPEVTFPSFVKPNCESRSIGISDQSVVESRTQLQARVEYVHRELAQGALIEEYLPGPEYTVLMLGNGKYQELLPGIVNVEAKHYGKYPVLRSDLRGVGLTKIAIPETRVEEAKEITRKATDALQCWDHVRVDLRVGADGRLRIMEVNGIPGLKPYKSWSPQIYSLYHPSPDGHMAQYREMLALIVNSARERHGLH